MDRQGCKTNAYHEGERGRALDRRHDRARGEGESRDMKSVEKIDLKEKLDDIDKEIGRTVHDGYFNSRLRVLVGLWEKGEAIYTFTGGKSIKFGFWTDPAPGPRPSASSARYPGSTWTRF